MRITITLITLLFIGMAGCSEHENSTKYYDSHTYKRFIEKLDKNGVKYRKGEEMNVFYPVSQSHLVSAIASEIRAEYHPGCGGNFSTKEKQEAMVKELKKRNIPFTVVERDEGPSITCAPEDREAFNEAFMSVLRGKFSE